MTDSHTIQRTPMFRVTRKSQIIGTIRQSDLTTHGDLLARAKYELAQMVGGNLARSILRGRVTQYSDGSLSISPVDSRGNYSTDGKKNLITFWFTPYTL